MERKDFEIGQRWKLRSALIGMVVQVYSDRAILSLLYNGTQTAPWPVDLHGKVVGVKGDHPFDVIKLVPAPAQSAETATETGYEQLLNVLMRAYDQAAKGKGKERHASGNTPFHEQPMATINRQLGSVDGFIYQAHKKSLEATRLPQGRNVAELLGAINYLAGAVIALESWAKKES